MQLEGQLESVQGLGVEDRVEDAERGAARNSQEDEVEGGGPQAQVPGFGSRVEDVSSLHPVEEERDERFVTGK